jgi:hypothetical protein
LNLGSICFDIIHSILNLGSICVTEKKKKNVSISSSFFPSPSFRYPPYTEAKLAVAVQGAKKRRLPPLPSGTAVVGFLTGIVAVLLFQAVIAVSLGRSWWPFD